MPTRDIRLDPHHTALPARSPTLADVRDLPAFAGCAVVPPAADLAREVRAVRPQGGHDAGEADLLLCDGAPPDPVPAGTGGVVCRLPPPAGCPVPALVLPVGTGWAAVLDDLADLVGPNPGRRAAQRARVALRTPLMDGGGFQGLMEVARDLLGAPVAVLDDYLDVLAEAGLGARETEMLDAAVRDARHAGPASMIGALFNDAPEDLIRVMVPGVIDGATAVLVSWLPRPPAISQVATLRELAEACAMEVGRQDVRTHTEQALRGDLIRELMAGEAVSRESLVRRARHLGADLAGGAVAMLGRLEDPHEPGRVITDERLARRLLQQTRAVLDMHWPRALVDWDEGRLLVLLPGPREQEDPEREGVEARAHTLSGRLIAATKETVPGLALTLAISRFTPQPERLGAALEEAGLALSIGERLGRVGDVVTFEETGTYKLLFQIFADRPHELAAFFEQTLEPLVRYDEQYQTELVATLATYLEFDCNLASTASTLFTHRHTVRYRLDRIAELSGLDIGRTDDREKLSLGLKAMRLLGKRIPVPLAKEAGRAKQR
ncbi:MAG: helix-turn-helix domain-containing protein [Thermoleophilia bacterium]